MKPRLLLVQLPIPPVAAFAPSGNVALAAGSLAVAARRAGGAAPDDIAIAPSQITEALGDTLLADAVAAGEPEVVGLSLYLWNSERSLHLARAIKARSPRTQIVIGGPEVGPDNPYVTEQDGFDLAVTGEAEEIFARLLPALRVGGLPEVAALPGIGVRSAGGPMRWGPSAQPAMFALQDVPSPYLEGMLAVDPQRSTYVETVRGCRSRCTYCFYPRSSTALRSLDASASAQVVERLRDAGAREIVFLDPTFNHRSGFDDLLQRLADVNGDGALRFFAEIRAEGLRSSHAKALRRAGFAKLELGLQSVNRETLRLVRRGGDPEQVAAAAKMLREQGIRLLVDLIVGLPGDSRDDILRGVEFLARHGLGADAQIFALAVLPGTEMRERATELRLVFEDAPPYRVVRTSTLSQDALLNVFDEVEAVLDRPLEESARPFLVAPQLTTAVYETPDTFVLDVDRNLAEQHQALSRPGAAHVALWLRGADLYAARHALAGAVAARLAVDPYATLDVVLQPRHEFPLDLLDFLRRCLDQGPACYATRSMRHRGVDALRRIAVVLGRDTRLDADYLMDVAARVPVFCDQGAVEAMRTAALLGSELPGARILDMHIDERLFRDLVASDLGDALVFADRTLERRYVHEALGLSDIAE